MSLRKLKLTKFNFDNINRETENFYTCLKNTTFNELILVGCYFANEDSFNLFFYNLCEATNKFKTIVIEKCHHSHSCRSFVRFVKKNIHFITSFSLKNNSKTLMGSHYVGRLFGILAKCERLSYLDISKNHISQAKLGIIDDSFEHQ